MSRIQTILLGSVAGLLSGMLGIGGGLVVGPALMLSGFSPARAFGTALWVVAPVASVAVIAGLFTTHEQTMWLTALWIAIGGQLGAPAGARIVQVLPAKQLRYLFIAFLLYVAFRNLGIVPGEEHVLLMPRYEIVLTALLTIAIGIVAGVTSSLFGVGGGVVVVPGLLMLVGGFTFQAAAATSLAAMVPTAVRGAWIARAQQRLDFDAAIVLIPSSTICAVFAVWLRDNVVGADFLHTVFGCFLLFAAITLWRK